MKNGDLISNYGVIGRVSSWAAFFFGIVYIVITILGFLSLKSPQEPIGEPFFTLMELLIILIAPLMAISMVAVHCHASDKDKIYSLSALFFMFVMAGITSSIHFVILIVTHQIEASRLKEFPWLFSFKWPSVVYSLDILSWDWFFALSILFAAPVFKVSRLEKILRTLMIVCGFISLAGLIGVPLKNMQVRNIGIIGYGVIAPFVFLLIGIVVGRSRQVPPDITQRNSS